jgi:aminopeptidase YwaD
MTTRPNFVDLLGSQIGPRMAGSEQAERAATEISAAMENLGLEVHSQTFEFMGFVPEQPSLEVDGLAWDVAPCPYTRGADVTGTVRFVGFLDQDSDGDAPVFAIEGPAGRELARLYAAPDQGGAVPTMTTYGPVLGGPAAAISSRDGRRLRKLDGAAVRLHTEGAFLCGRHDRNVIGRLVGEMDEWVAVTCHFDSVWRGPGVLDNATGVEGMFQVLERVIDPPRRRGVLACAFAAEEIGLLGSRYFVTNARIDGSLASIVGAVNLDAIGHGDYLEVSVAPTELEGRVLSLATSLGISSRYPIVLRYPLPDADDYHFAVQGIPTVSLVHFPYPEYHSPGEVPGLVDPTRMAHTVELATHLVLTQLALPVPTRPRPVVNRKLSPQ